MSRPCQYVQFDGCEQLAVGRFATGKNKKRWLCQRCVDWFGADKVQQVQQALQRAAAPSSSASGQCSPAATGLAQTPPGTAGQSLPRPPGVYPNAAPGPRNMRGSVANAIVEGDPPWKAKGQKLVHEKRRQELADKAQSQKRWADTACTYGVWAEKQGDIQIPPPKEAEIRACTYGAWAEMPSDSVEIRDNAEVAGDVEAPTEHTSEVTRSDPVDEAVETDLQSGAVAGLALRRDVRTPSQVMPFCRAEDMHYYGLGNTLSYQCTHCRSFWIEEVHFGLTGRWCLGCNRLYCTECSTRMQSGDQLERKCDLCIAVCEPGTGAAASNSPIESCLAAAISDTDRF